MIVNDISSIAPKASQEICALAQEKGVVMLDAPVSGGEPKAIDGTLAIMVGGDAGAFAKVKSLLEKDGHVCRACWRHRGWKCHKTG